MTINQDAEASIPSGSAARILRGTLTVSGGAGTGYVISWIAGLSVPAPSPRFDASGSAIVSALAGHHTAVALQFALTEGLPAAGIAVVSVALARAARDRGALVAGRLALIFGAVAATISAVQFLIGMALVATSEPGTAHLLYAAVNRIDGVKMLTLAGLGAAGAAGAFLPRWLRWTGVALAVSIAVSGVVFLLLLQGLNAAAAPALVLLLVFVGGTGLVLGAARIAGR